MVACAISAVLEERTLQRETGKCDSFFELVSIHPSDLLKVESENSSSVVVSGYAAELDFWWRTVATVIPQKVTPLPNKSPTGAMRNTTWCPQGDEGPQTRCLQGSQAALGNAQMSIHETLLSGYEILAAWLVHSSRARRRRGRHCPKEGLKV